MPAYVIANVEVRNPEAYREYVEAVPGSVAAYGGRYLARAGEVEVLEGDWQPSRLVILEFPSVEAARAWYTCAEYEAVKQIRIQNADSQLVLTSGAPSV